MNQIVIKKSDIAQLPPFVRNNPEAMKILNAILADFTKLEKMLGIDFVLESEDTVPVEVIPDPAPGTPAPAETNSDAPTSFLQIKGVSGDLLLFNFEHSDSWPITHGDSHNFVGHLMMQSDQMSKPAFVDGMSTANAKDGRKTLENAFGGGEHSLNVNHDEHLRVWIQQGKLKSNIVDWKWPLRST